MIATFITFGIAIAKAVTVTFRPSFLVITLNGLKILANLKTFNIFKRSDVRVKETTYIHNQSYAMLTEKRITTLSRMFMKLLR
jgi:hypothetical protein